MVHHQLLRTLYCCGDQKKLFQIVDKLLGRENKIVLPDYSDAKSIAQIFNEFFETIIANIRTLFAALENSIDVMLCPPVESLFTPRSSKLLCFRPTNALEITEIVIKSSKATCILDPIPTSLLHDLLAVLAPVIADLVNSSLATGVFPSELKSAMITPLLEKPSLDTDDK